LEKFKKHIRVSILAEVDMLTEAITNEQNMRYPEFYMYQDELIEMRKRFITLIADCMTSSEEERVSRAREEGTAAGYTMSRNNFGSLDMFVREVPHYRNTIGSFIKYEVIEKGFSVSELYEILTILDSVIHDYIYFFSTQYVEYEKQVIARSKEMVTELSVPLVSLNDEIAILPLIGTIDTERGNMLRERVLREAYDMKVRTLIIDVSGLQAIDTFVAQQLFQLFEAMSLLGIRPIVSGVTPAIAQTFVQLCLSFGEVSSYSSLKLALKELFR
jgi:rsbT co-antagonist protein RsbR